MSQNPCYSRYFLNIKSPYIPPKVFKIAPILANYAKFADHFSIRTTRNGTLKFHSKLHENRVIRRPKQ